MPLNDHNNIELVPTTTKVPVPFVVVSKVPVPFVVVFDKKKPPR